MTAVDWQVVICQFLMEKRESDLIVTGSTWYLDELTREEERFFVDRWIRYCLVRQFVTAWGSPNLLATRSKQ